MNMPTADMVLVWALGNVDIVPADLTPRYCCAYSALSSCGERHLGRCPRLYTSALTARAACETIPITVGMATGNEDIGL